MMKLPSFLLFAAVSLAASAQVKVDSLNRLILGNDGYIYPLAPGIQSTKSDLTPGGGITVPDIFPLDSLSRMCVVGNGSNKSGGYITFGNNRHVSVGELNSKLKDN